jgi:hypothetical protein
MNVFAAISKRDLCYSLKEMERKLLELIIINYNMYGLICNKYILYNGLLNYTLNKVIKLCIGFIIFHEKWTL